jgi:hypothetical protein
MSAGNPPRAEVWVRAPRRCSGCRWSRRRETETAWCSKTGLPSPDDVATAPEVKQLQRTDARTHRPANTRARLHSTNGGGLHAREHRARARVLCAVLTLKCHVCTRLRAGARSPARQTMQARVGYIHRAAALHFGLRCRLREAQRGFRRASNFLHGAARMLPRRAPRNWSASCVTIV